MMLLKNENTSLIFYLKSLFNIYAFSTLFIFYYFLFFIIYTFLINLLFRNGAFFIRIILVNQKIIPSLITPFRIILYYLYDFWVLMILTIHFNYYNLSFLFRLFPPLPMKHFGNLRD